MSDYIKNYYQNACNAEEEGSLIGAFLWLSQGYTFLLEHARQYANDYVVKNIDYENNKKRADNVFRKKFREYLKKDWILYKLNVKMGIICAKIDPNEIGWPKEQIFEKAFNHLEEAIDCAPNNDFMDGKLWLNELKKGTEINKIEAMAKHK